MNWVTTSAILTSLSDFEDQTAWNRFTDRFRTPIMAFAIRLGLKEVEAEDVAQETLLAFADGFRKGSYDPSKGRLSDWLFGIAYRQLQNMRRKLARNEVQVVPGESGTSFWSGLPDQNEATKSWSEEWARAK